MCLFLAYIFHELYILISFKVFLDLKQRFSFGLWHKKIVENIG